MFQGLFFYLFFGDFIMIGLGTLVNVLAILMGGIFVLFFGKRLEPSM